MSIPTKDTDPLSVESQRRDSDTHVRTQQMMMNDQMQGLEGIVAFFMMLFGGVQNGGNTQLFKSQSFEKLSSAFGLEPNAVRRTAERVYNNHTDYRTASRDLSRNVNTSNVDWSKAKDVKLNELIGNGNAESMLHPTLVDRMEKSPALAQKVQWAVDAAERHGLDGKLYANQLWQESRFNENATSPAGAKGVAQFMPHHIGKWGLTCEADLRDPKTSIEAGARFMKFLTDRTGGSQELAMVAYNGDFKAIEYADKNVAGDGVTIGQWMGFMEHERATKGYGRAGLWRNETYGYIKKICPQYWDEKTLAKAVEQKEEMLAKNGGDLTKEHNDAAVASATGAGAIKENEQDTGTLAQKDQETSSDPDLVASGKAPTVETPAA